MFPDASTDPQNLFGAATWLQLLDHRRSREPTAIVVDPGGAAERILREVRALGLTVTRILHTHAHFDHFLASGEMKNATGAALCLHEDDRELWDMPIVLILLIGLMGSEWLYRRSRGLA